MNSVRYLFTPTTKEQAFLHELNVFPLAYLEVNDEGYKFMTLVPTFLETRLEELFASIAEKVGAEVNVKGFYQDPGTGESTAWYFTCGKPHVTLVG